MRKKQAKILIVDDDEAILFSAKVALRRFFTEIITLQNPRKIHSFLADVDVVLLDMNFRKGFEDGNDGLYWLHEIQHHNPLLPVVLMTAYGEVDLAVEALKKGACDFILKPWQNQKLYSSINIAVELSRKNRKIQQWEQSQTKTSPHLLKTNSPRMQTVLNTIEKIAPTDANVLLTGENGTGKFVLAEHIHQLSKRKKEPFVSIDLGSLPESLFEAELFGYAQGAFTDAKKDTPGKIESANGGTVFLDEIGNLPLPLQSKLLTLIQKKTLRRIGESKERVMDVRFLFATNENLYQCIADNKFRSDLYYRINTVELELPALRERLEDLPMFIDYFKQKYEKKYNKTALKIRAEQSLSLSQYAWPGNLRELDHTLERSVIMSGNEELEISLPKTEGMNLPETLNLEEMEASLINKAMRKYQGNISQAADALGLSRAALYRRLEKFNL